MFLAPLWTLSGLNLLERLLVEDMDGCGEFWQQSAFRECRINITDKRRCRSECTVLDWECSSVSCDLSSTYPSVWASCIRSSKECTFSLLLYVLLLPLDWRRHRWYFDRLCDCWDCSAHNPYLLVLSRCAPMLSLLLQ
jgi:hypothetical protein